MRMAKWKLMCQKNVNLLTLHFLTEKDELKDETMHYGEVEKNSQKWSTLGAYFSAIFRRKCV